MRKMSFSCKMIFLTLTLLLTAGLVACGGGDTPAETTPDTLQDTEVVPTTEATTEEVTQTNEDTQADTALETAPDTTPEATTEAVTDVMIGETLDADYAADFLVSNVFSNDMVVQRGEHIRVWGTAPASENGKKVTGEFKGMFAEALIENGEWVLTFGARLDASTEMGHTMKIYTDKKQVKFDNVLVGDVYMVIGQSNVAYSMANHWAFNNTPDKGGQTAIDDNAPIRIHYNSLSQTTGYPQRGTKEVCTELRNGSVWQKATKTSIGNFTAIGYLFAYNMIDLTDNQVPVGIIEIDGNGAPLGTFMPNEVADATGSDAYNSAKGYYETPNTSANYGASRYMYNHYMFPFEKYAIAGIVWYQGESDYHQNNAKVFANNFTALMTYMRGTHNLVNKTFPVYMIEFPTNYQQHPDFVASTAEPFWAAMDVGLIRSVLGSVPQILPNSYVTTSSDLWTDDTFWNTLHPNCKFEQAQRCAKIAAAVLGIGDKAAATGPILTSIEVSGKTAVLTFDNVGEGLKTSDGEKAVKGFGLIDKSFRVTDAGRCGLEATITAPNQITITSNRRITGIIYNFVYWNEYGEHVNLCNSYGVPACATLMFAEEK